MKCHYVYDDVSKQKVLIPGCWEVVRSDDISRCTCDCSDDIGCKHLLVEAVEYSNTDEEFTGVRPRRKFTCNIDGKVMCHPKIRTFSKERQELIMSISQKIMPNMNEECRFYEDAGIPF